MHTTIPRRLALVAACLVTAASFSACGDDADTATDTPDTTAVTDAPEETTATTVADDDAAGETVVVTAVDYGFEGLPETVPVGTKISLVTEGNEPHEFIAMLIPADETRSVEELVKLPEEELAAVFGAAEPAAVILAATGQTDVPGAVVGDGTLTEPGRYAIVCFLPMGSDDSILESEGPPPAGGAAPPSAPGMVTELEVVA
jgi:plastocyanin